MITSNNTIPVKIRQQSLTVKIRQSADRYILLFATSAWWLGCFQFQREVKEAVDQRRRGHSEFLDTLGMWSSHLGSGCIKVSKHECNGSMNIHTYSLMVDMGVSGIHDDAGVGPSRGGFGASLCGIVPLLATNAADGATGRWRLR
jgi:hypothetical protein